MNGQGAIAVERSAGRSVFHTARAEAPLKLLLPERRGGAAWAVVASLGGGLVGGDAIALDVHVAERARAFIGTQASTKVFRSEIPTSQSLVARVEDDAALVVLPDPVAPFARSTYRQSTEVTLAERATLVLAEVATSGRAARGERWDFDRFSSRIVVRRGGRPVVFDAIDLDAAHGDLRARLGRFDALASVVAVGPLAHDVRRALVAWEPSRTPGAALLGFARALGDDVAFARFAATSVELASRAVRERLGGVAAILGDDPFARLW